MNEELKSLLQNTDPVQLSRQIVNNKSTTVRRTFKVSEEVLVQIEYLRNFSNLTQSEYLNNLAVRSSMLFPEDKPLNISQDIRKKKRVPKTMVVPRIFMNTIEKYSESLKMHRDDILEYMVNRDRELFEPYLKKVRSAGKIVDKTCEYLDRKQEAINEVIEHNNAIKARFGFSFQVLLNLGEAIDDLIKKGTPINEDDL